MTIAKILRTPVLTVDALTVGVPARKNYNFSNFNATGVLSRLMNGGYFGTLGYIVHNQHKKRYFLEVAGVCRNINSTSKSDILLSGKSNNVYPGLKSF